MEFVPYTILYHGNNEHYLIEKELLNKYLLLKQETIPFLKDKTLKVLYSRLLDIRMRDELFQWFPDHIQKGLRSEIKA